MYRSNFLSDDPPVASCDCGVRVDCSSQRAQSKPLIAAEESLPQHSMPKAQFRRENLHFHWDLIIGHGRQSG